MAKTSTERQRELRARRSRDNGEQRLDMWVRTSASLALFAIARRRGLSLRHALEHVLLEADAAEDKSGVTR